MLKQVFGVVLAVILAVPVGSVLAEEDDSGPRGEGRRGRRMRRGRRGEGRRGEGRGERGRMERGPDRDRRRGRDENPIERIRRGFDLSEEKQQQVEQILRTHRQAVKAWRDEHGEEGRALREELRKARKAGDTKKVKEIRQKIKAIMDGRKEVHDGLIEQLGEVLTEEQLRRVQRMMDRGMRRRGTRRMLWGRALRELDLTEDQNAKIKKIREEARAKAGKGDDPRRRGEIAGDVMQKILKEVLTDKQRDQLKTMRRSNRDRMGKRLFRGLDLTEDQAKRIRAIDEKHDELLWEAKSADERREINRDRRKKIGEVLTAEQRAKLRERMGRRGRDDRGERDDGPRNRRGGRRGGRRGRGGPGGRGDGPGPELD